LRGGERVDVGRKRNNYSKRKLKKKGDTRGDPPISRKKNLPLFRRDKRKKERAHEEKK